MSAKRSSARKRVLDFAKLRWHSRSLAERKALVEEFGLRAQDRYGDTFWGWVTGSVGAEAVALARWLVARGQSIHEKDGDGRAALHRAAACGNVTMVRWLLSLGLPPAPTDRSRGTPLDLMLERARNADLPARARVMKLLIDSGAKVSGRTEKAARHVYSEMDYYRTEMAPRFAKQCEAAARTICALAGVQAPKPRLLHDGKGAIEVPPGNAEKQFASLWNFLVPPAGRARTLQGEIVRVAGRINDELMRNGGANWDRDFAKMVGAFTQYVRRHEALDGKRLEAVDATVAAINKSKGRLDDARALCLAAIAWVRANPKPIKLGKVAYRR